ncbi:hypothetical protein Tco_0099416 [Tanacetum coccineum]
MGYHLTFKDSEGNVVASMSGFLKFPMVHGVQIGHVAKEKKKSQEGQNKAAGKRPGRVGAPVCTKKRKTTPLSMTTSSILNDAKQRRDMPINNPLEAICTWVAMSEDNMALQQVHLDCDSKEATLAEKLAVVEKEKDDLLDKIKD